MHRRRHAKIVATLGPASSDIDTIRALFDAGADAVAVISDLFGHDETGEVERAARALDAVFRASRVGA